MLLRLSIGTAAAIELFLLCLMGFYTLTSTGDQLSRNLEQAFAVIFAAVIVPTAGPALALAWWNRWLPLAGLLLLIPIVGLIGLLLMWA